MTDEELAQLALEPENQDAELSEDIADVYPPDDMDDDADIPEKFHGKSRAEIAQSYRELERVLGLPPERRADALQDMGLLDEEPAYEPDYAQEADVQDLLPLYQTEYIRLAEQDRMTLEHIGYAKDEIARRLEESTQNRALLAWQAAQTQGQYLHGLIDQRMGTAGESFPDDTAPTDIPGDVDAVLDAAPVHGVTADEVAEAIQQVGIPAREWAQTPPDQRQQFIYQAAVFLAYRKFAGDDIPAQEPEPVGAGMPRAHGMVDSALRQAARQLMTQAQGLSEEEALAVVRDAQQRGRS